jgi:hypothetical protein
MHAFRPISIFRKRAPFFSVIYKYIWLGAVNRLRKEGMGILFSLPTQTFSDVKEKARRDEKRMSMGNCL